MDEIMQKEIYINGNDDDIIEVDFELVERLIVKVKLKIKYCLDKYCIILKKRSKQILVKIEDLKYFEDQGFKFKEKIFNFYPVFSYENMDSKGKLYWYDLKDKQDITRIKFTDKQKKELSQKLKNLSIKIRLQKGE